MSAPIDVPQREATAEISQDISQISQMDMEDTPTVVLTDESYRESLPFPIDMRDAAETTPEAVRKVGQRFKLTPNGEDFETDYSDSSTIRPYGTRYKRACRRLNLDKEATIQPRDGSPVTFTLREILPPLPRLDTVNVEHFHYQMLKRDLDIMTMRYDILAEEMDEMQREIEELKRK